MVVKTEKHFVSLVSTCLLPLWFHQFYLKESEIEHEEHSPEKEELRELQRRLGEKHFTAVPGCLALLGLEVRGSELSRPSCTGTAPQAGTAES